jgi:dienelactone hydrolase
MRRCFACLFLLLALCSAACAALRESVHGVEVTVLDPWKKTVTQTITVTVWADDANPAPAPLMVIGHGRAVDAAGRAAVSRARYSEVAKYFVNRGFIVAVPTRIGYGQSGGEDVENSGPCDNKRYAPGFDAAAAQNATVFQWLRSWPGASPDRGVYVGQSFGGSAAVALAGLSPPGVQLSINFAGGAGGNPQTRPQQPCSPQSVAKVFADYGAKAQIPMLWVYTENDQFMGPIYPRHWHAAFVGAGGKAEFEQYGPHGQDGHSLFVRFPAVWQSRVAAFLDANGFAAVNAK